ncbi:NUDIX hydrolase [Microvirga sp. VF16]|nr:NUDIX hydrolase [Microvirga sp. VF16]QRM32014.1 NUDIX hydrolase [Microvirga sp. VF16]
MRVREDAIIRQDGSPGIYGVVEKTDFAIIAPIENGMIHLVEQYRYPVQGRYWELPQGSWEEAPAIDPLELARAELREETGLTAETMRHVGHLFECYGYSNQGFHIYLAQGLRQGETYREQTEQDMISRAFPIDEVLAMITEGVVKDAATVATLGLLRLKGLI